MLVRWLNEQGWRAESFDDRIRRRAEEGEGGPDTEAGGQRPRTGRTAGDQGGDQKPAASERGVGGYEAGNRRRRGRAGYKGHRGGEGAEDNAARGTTPMKAFADLYTRAGRHHLQQWQAGRHA